MEEKFKNQLTKEERKVYDFISYYTQNFDYKKLNDFENEIFGKLNKKQRIEMEYHRLKEELKRKPNLYTKYLSELIEIEKLIKILDFDTTIDNDIITKIINIQIEIEQSIRLFGELNKIEENLKYISFYRSTEPKELKR